MIDEIQVDYFTYLYELIESRAKEILVKWCGDIGNDYSLIEVLNSEIVVMENKYTKQVVKFPSHLLHDKSLDDFVGRHKQVLDGYFTIEKHSDKKVVG